MPSSIIVGATCLTILALASCHASPPASDAANRVITEADWHIEFVNGFFSVNGVAAPPLGCCARDYPGLRNLPPSMRPPPDPLTVPQRQDIEAREMIDGVPFVIAANDANRATKPLSDTSPEDILVKRLMARARQRAGMTGSAPQIQPR